MIAYSKCVVFAGYLAVCLIGLHCIKSNWLFVLLGLVCSSAHNELTTCISTSKLYCLSSLAKAARSVATLAACVPTLLSSHSHAMGHLCCALLLSVWVCCIRTFHAANDVFICHVSSPHTQPVSQSVHQSISPSASSTKLIQLVSRFSLSIASKWSSSLRGQSERACGGLVHCKCSQFLWANNAICLMSSTTAHTER